MKQKQPSAFLLENVKQLLTHDKGQTFAVIQEQLSGLGYTIYHKVLNALDFGLPQKRERIFIIGFREPIAFAFPKPIGTYKPLSEILEPDEDVEPNLFASERIQQSRREKCKGTPFFPSIWHENKGGNISVLPLLLEVLDVKIGVHINNINNTILSEFSDFTEKVLGLSEDTPELYQTAKVYRVGVTNAADRGLDMWANFGVAIQIKHISLTPTTIEDISSTISADRIIIVCKESEKDILVSVLQQFGSANRIQSIITEDELDEWYEKALRGQSSELIGDKILQKLANEI